MAITLAQLINGKDKNTIKAELLTLLAKNGFDANDWESGSESRTLLEIESDSLAQLWTTVTNIANGMYLDTATDGWLTLLAKSGYGLDRILAEYTRGVATFTLVNGGGPRTISAGAVIVDDNLGHAYVTDNAVPVNLTGLAPSAQVEIIAQQTGAAYNVAAGTITHVAQGPADITVNNIGLLTPASITGTANAPYTVNTKTLIYTVTVDGVDTAPITYTFAANYATTALLAAALNGDVAFSANLIASDSGGFLKITTIKSGPNQALIIDGFGTANLDLGFAFGANTTSVGGTTVDQPAAVYGAFLAGPFNVSGETLTVTVTVDGFPLTPDTVLFPSNYNTLDQVIAAFSGGIGYTTINDNGRLKIQTIKTGPKQSIVLSKTGTANPSFGFSTSIDSVSVGTSSWLLQEGRDEESDDSLRTRCKARWGILGAGTRDAFLTWAKEADPKVQKVAVYSNYLNGTPKAGAVTVYIAGLNSALDAATVSNVYNYILAKIPIMSDLYVGTVMIFPVYYSGILTITSAVNTPQYISGYKNNINIYSQSLGIGQGVLKKRIEAEIISALRPGFIDLNLTEPISPLTTIDKNQLCVITEDPAAPMIYIVR